ncbi:MAG TPA: phosphatidylinositol mannoside acyltransferase, partial [Streptosporangiaceae bacterium]|nr:phosphatidylinositol mannoside acyltransferase [Streptosporangiaceae bacterium]
HVHDEIPVPAEGDRKQKVAVMTQQVARLFEEGIRQHPADWHMLQRVFVADLDPARLAAADAAAAGRAGTAAGAGVPAAAGGGAPAAAGGPAAGGAPAAGGNAQAAGEP